MPNLITHLTQALHNEELARSLATKPMRYKDWSIVACFYSAIHYVEAALAMLGKHSYDHHIRQKMLEANWADVGPVFYRLRKASDQARYLAGSMVIPGGEYFREGDVLSFLDEDLERIKQAVGLWVRQQAEI